MVAVRQSTFASVREGPVKRRTMVAAPATAFQLLYRPESLVRHLKAHLIGTHPLPPRGAGSAPTALADV